MQNRSPVAYLGWTAAFGMVLFYALIPVLWLVSLSLKTPTTVEDKRFIPKQFTLDNYTALFQGGFDSPLLRPLINSVAIALIATTIAVTLASFTAYAIATELMSGRSSGESKPPSKSVV